MTGIRWFAKWRLVLALVAVTSLIQAVDHGQTARPRRIAVFGSSVANGTGDEFQKEGYTGLLRELMAPRGWEVLNQSRGGDTTIRIAPRFAPEGTPDPNTRYLLPVNPGYVVIGLSLANEGIFEAKTKEEKDAVYKQYSDGIKSLIDRARQNNIVPIVALCYPRMVYTPVEYEYVRRINVLHNSWNVPSVNFAGALDDGTGRYTLGFDFDDKHPNAMGHREFLYTFVPTMFEALEKGKPTPTRPANAKGFARIAGGNSPLTFAPQDTMHPFAISVMVRTQSDGTVASVGGSTLSARREMKKVNTTEFEEITLSPDRSFAATIGVQGGKWTYTSANGTSVASAVSADARWHHIVLSHYTARGETLFFVDGKLSGKIAERLQPTRFVVGGPGATGAPAAPKQADYKDVYIFRAALNADEVAALNQGKVLQASLETYSPLTDSQFQPNSMVENRAQSMTGLKIGSDRIRHVEEAGDTN
jgi:lysophospholipase L1-like esterase